MKNTMNIRGRLYTIYDQSIKVDGIGPVFYFKRRVDETDAYQLDALYRVGHTDGEKHVVNKMRDALILPRIS